MIASVLIIAFSLVLFVYWFRYSCLLLLRNRSEESAATTSRFDLASVKQGLNSGMEMDPLAQSLEHDYRLLTYLLEHAANLELEQLEYRLLVLDYRMMQGWYRLTKFRCSAAGQARARRDGGCTEPFGCSHRPASWHAE